MTLNQQQLLTLQGLADSEVGKSLISIFEDYINEIKDEVIEDDLDKAAAKVAISKLREITNKLKRVGDDGTTAPTKNPCI